MPALNDFSSTSNTKKKRKRNFWYILVKVALIFMGATILLNLLIFGIAYLNHRSKLTDEEQYLIEPGQLVEVNGHYMHVYITGNEDAETTLVFMHNNKDSDACISLRPLFAYLEEDYRIVYVDRSGNGYSEVSGESRDIDTMLEETRTAVAEAGVTGSFVLVPNGTAGNEAVYWAEKYPDEVDAIIGINMAYPEQSAGETLDAGYDRYGKTLMFFSKIGGHRFLSNTYPENDLGLYTEREMIVRDALISRYYYTEDMYNEELNYYTNAEYVAEYADFPDDIPMLMIWANPLLEPYFSYDEDMRSQYEDILEDYSDEMDLSGEYNKENFAYFEDYDNVTCVELSGPVALFEFDPEGVAEYMLDYLDDMQLDE